MLERGVGRQEETRLLLSEEGMETKDEEERVTEESREEGYEGTIGAVLSARGAREY